MALTTQTMTDEQRKSVAIEYLKAFDNGGVTSSGSSILELFADDAQVYFPKWGLANGKDQIGKLFGDVGATLKGITHHFSPLQLDLLGQRHPGRRGHESRRAPRRPVASGSPRIGCRALVRCLRDPRLEDPAGLHLPRPRLRRKGHRPISVAEDLTLQRQRPARRRAS